MSSIMGSSYVRRESALIGHLNSRKSNSVNSRYFLIENKGIVYEYSLFIEALGEDLVAKACEAVREQKTKAEVCQKTWKDNYVIRLGYLLLSLEVYQQNSKDNKPIDDFESEDWIKFGNWLSAQYGFVAQIS